jgi:hypothetical protein
MSLNVFNNFGIGSVAIMAVLNHCKSLPIDKITLIYPFIAHQDLLSYLSNSRANVKSLDKLLIEKTVYFSNFNSRYYDSLANSFNALQYLNDQGYIELKENIVYQIKELEYSKGMGKRVNKIFSASENIASILNELSEKLYLNLRIEL